MTSEATVFWGLAASAVAIMVFEGSQGLGLSRLNLPLLFGSYFTGQRRAANMLGIVVYLIGGGIFTVAYLWAFEMLRVTSLVLPLVIGLLHGAFLLVVVMPTLPYIHPRIASEYDSPTRLRRLEPPGFVGLHYGLGTPLTTLVAHAAYAVVLGFGYVSN